MRIQWRPAAARLGYLVAVGLVVSTTLGFNLWAYFGQFAGQCLYGRDSPPARFASFLGKYLGHLQPHVDSYLLSDELFFFGSHASAQFLGAGHVIQNFAAPIAGAKTVMLEEFSPEAALALIEKERATAIGVVPTHLIRMLEADVSKYDLSSLRFIRSAGGYLPPQVAEEAEAAFGASITSDLGTQDMGSVSGCRVEDSKDLRRRTVGRMLPGNKVRLANQENRALTVPDGEPGILYFRGPHAPAGYYRDEELTSTVFDRDGWTTTEDIVKFDQGCLWILGRAKDMVIRGGQNIYPAEVEGLLADHPAIGSVAIVGYPDKEMGERCAAYVIPKAGMTFTFKDMVDHLKAKEIAMFKLPEHLEIVAEFPTVGDSGKINKETLKKDIRERLGLA